MPFPRRSFAVSRQRTCPAWIIRVGLAAYRRLPLHPYTQTSLPCAGIWRSLGLPSQNRAILRKQAMEILVASLLANAGLSQSIEDVVVLTTKLRVVRTCVAHLMEPLDREVRSDCIQFG